jgi:hypothetical protein
MLVYAPLEETCKDHWQLRSWRPTTDIRLGRRAKGLEKHTKQKVKLDRIPARTTACQHVARGGMKWSDDDP